MLNPGFWKGRRVFLTGYTGFKGSWLSMWLNVLDVSSAEQIDVERLGIFWILNFSDGHHSLLDTTERAYMPFWSLREGARRLEECGLLTVSNDNVFE
jgi:winged helix-turn-helix